MKIQADGLRIGDVIRTETGDPVTVRDLKREAGGCLTTNPDAPDQLDGHAWEWVEVISRGPLPPSFPDLEPDPDPEEAPEGCTCPPEAPGEEDAEPCGAEDCEVRFRMEVGWT